MKKKIIILVGIPCSGKSTWANMFKYANAYIGYKTGVTEIISRDSIRLQLFGKNYKQHGEAEKRVTSTFNTLLHNRLSSHTCNIVVLDNTHCKESYISDIVYRYKDNYNIRVKFFDIPLWKAHWRNITRYLTTGKWIPIKVINQMYKNYNKINKQRYAEYMVH